jgi:glutamate-1-semialdehyde aminotransferase
VIVGRLLAERFGLPLWQMATTASDANRAAIRWARAVTERPVILVFDGCYHGMVDDAFVVLRDGSPVMKPGLLGQVHDLTATTRVVPFNDPEALAAALAPGDVAAVLAEPAMTNCGMILPRRASWSDARPDPPGRDPADHRRDPHDLDRPRRLRPRPRPGARTCWWSARPSPAACRPRSGA